MVAIAALQKGDASRSPLWTYHLRDFRGQGAKFAGGVDRGCKAGAWSAVGTLAARVFAGHFSPYPFPPAPPALHPFGVQAGTLPKSKGFGEGRGGVGAGQMR